MTPCAYRRWQRLYERVCRVHFGMTDPIGDECIILGHIACRVRRGEPCNPRELIALRQMERLGKFASERSKL